MTAASNAGWRRPARLRDLPQIDLLINATDGYGFALANITIFVEDVDEPPVLDTLPTGLGVRENASNQVRLRADPDLAPVNSPLPLRTLHPPAHAQEQIVLTASDDGGNVALAWELVGGGHGAFDLSTDGALSVAVGVLLDFKPNHCTSM